MKSSASTKLNMCINFLDRNRAKAIAERLTVFSISNVPKINIFRLTARPITKLF